MIGIGLIGVSFAGYWLKTVPLFHRSYLGIVSLLFIAPGIQSTMIGLFLVLPIYTILNFFIRRSDGNPFYFARTLE